MGTMNYRPEVLENMNKWISEQTVMLEKEIMEAKAKEMSDDIDREILWGMMEGIGWTRVIIPSETAMTQATRILEWLTQNCQAPYEKHYSDFIFEDSRDATMFILRWK
jgi:hypothetical protein